MTKAQSTDESTEVRQRLVESETAEDEGYRAKAAYRTAIEHSLQGVAIIQNAGVVFANQAVVEMSGYTREELLAFSPDDLRAIVHPEDQERVSARMQDFLAGKAKSLRQEFRFMRRDGVVRWVEILASRITHHRQPAVQVACMDITVNRWVKKEIDRLTKFRSENPNPVLRVSEDGIILYANQASSPVLDVWDCRTGQLLPDDWREFVLRVAGSGVDKETELKCGARTFSLTFAPVAGAGYVNVYGLDITERKRAEEKLAFEAFHDALTGLPNRALFMDRLKHAFERTKRYEDKLFAVLFLDLDRFKVINDSLGHTIGDQLLVEVARRLEEALRAADTLARLGGDEFVILLEEIQDIADATRVANRIQEKLSSPFNLEGYRAFTSASIGIVLGATDYDQADDILRDADIAMYRAKASDKASHEVFDSAMRERAVVRLELEAELRQAIERQEFQVCYQPIVSLETCALTGFEALLRWQHPRRGVVSPGDFISVAEETGLIIPIDRWVLREACSQIQEWQTNYPTDSPLTVSVNFSGKQFAQPDLIVHIEQVLQETGLDAHSLRLEITESVIIENVQSSAVMLSQLNAMGVQVQMDDFGTGYSSLSYLSQFPIDTIKIDRSFISGMDTAGSELGIIRTIVRLAHDLGMDAIAEGVETVDQLSQLRGLQCESGQGWYFSKAVDKNAAAALIAEMLTDEQTAGER